MVGATSKAATPQHSRDSHSSQDGNVVFQRVTVSCLEKIFVKVSKGSKASADTPPCGKPGLPSGRFFPQNVQM